MSDFQATYKKLCDYTRATSMFASIESLLGWDERTYMPAAAGEYRAEQMTLMSGLVHERRTHAQIGEWLDELAGSPLAADPHSVSGTVIRQLKRDYNRQTKLPRDLVEELTRSTVIGQQIWVQARQKDDFQEFRPILEKIFKLKREQAEALGYRECAYDALLDEFEPGALTSQIKVVLAGLRDQLVPLVAAIRESGRGPKTDLLQRHFPIDQQALFGTFAANQIGFEFDRGRLDITSHPFCTGLGPSDCRITTRYDANFFPGAFFGTLHEAGHGLYEQGLPVDQYGLPTGEAVSLGIHESQSRMWENQVGRSLSFWKYFFPKAQERFSEALQDVSVEEFYFAVNDVRPSLIRVEADEATYNLHILVRFELEQALINDELTVSDLPEAWNEKYQQYLGIRPSSDAEGVLQDVHWSAGLVGYFPTYSLGNLYSAQFFEAADRELGGLQAQFEKGEFLQLRGWLKRNIHQYGQQFSPTELGQRVAGVPLSHDALLRHLRSKLAPLYQLS